MLYNFLRSMHCNNLVQLGKDVVIILEERHGAHKSNCANYGIDCGSFCPVPHNNAQLACMLQKQRLRNVARSCCVCSVVVVVMVVAAAVVCGCFWVGMLPPLRALLLLLRSIMARPVKVEAGGFARCLERPRHNSTDQGRGHGLGPTLGTRVGNPPPV
jgi:hypothetical protein